MKRRYFEKIDTNEKAYLLGVLYADGCVYKRADRINGYRVELKMKDRDVIEFAHSQLELSGKIYEYTDGSKISTSCTQMALDLIDKGCVPRKTFILDKPNIDKKYLYPFLTGLIDGDGSLSYERNTIRIFSASEVFIEWLKEEFINLGYSPQKINYKSNDSTYTLTIGRLDEVKRFIENTYLSFSFSMKRKQDIAKQIFSK